jgi:tetratricopeptide (TPR) repeat protein
VGRGLGSHHPQVLEELSRAVVPPAGSPLAGWPRDLVLEWRGRERLTGADDAAAAAVFDELRAAGEGALAARLADEWQLAVRRALLTARQGELVELAEQVHARTTAGDVAGARAALERLAGAGGATAADWLALAQARREAGDAAGSGVAARHALDGLAGGQRVEALLLAGISAHAAHRTVEAFDCFREVQRLAPADARGYDYEARVRFAQRDVAGARSVVERGLAHVPGDPTLLQALQALTPAARR